MNTKDLTHSITGEDLQTIRKAKYAMEHLGWAIKQVNKVGNTLESGSRYIPNWTLSVIQKSTETILMGILKANLLTISKHKTFKKPSNNTYKAIITGSGAVGGFFGSTTGIGTAIFVSEMTLSTKFIMRTIMDIARSQGEDINSLEGQLQCLEVFTLGGLSKQDDGTETSYYVTRAALASALKNVTASGINAAIKTAVTSASVMGSNAVTKFIAQIAARFSVIFTEKFVAQALPIAGAVGGGTINLIFVDHFQSMANAHFNLRRLERKYGKDLVRQTYESLTLKRE
jgi:hypothetical protein